MNIARFKWPSAMAIAVLALSVIVGADESPQDSRLARLQVNFGEEVRLELDDSRRQEALRRLKEFLGIEGELREESREEATPEFMMELYHTVTDSDGQTKANNPYDATVVRSFIERDASSPHLYIFNVSGLELNESVLEAELHLYRKRASTNSVHPSVLSSPYYLIKVFQVLPDRSLEEPDLHRLLNVHYVGAYASGWQIYNVKQAALSWLEGAPNLGLLVAASTIFGDRVSVDFSRRGEQPRDKQPVLVLFDGDLPVEAQPEEGAEARSRRHTDDARGQPEVPGHADARQPEFYRREKRPARDFVPQRRSLEERLSSMQVYERALLRERLNGRRRTQGHGRRRREAAASECGKVETEACARRELHVNFKDIGLTNIIAPDGYAAYQCRGHCNSPLSQDQKPTNHATIQGIIHKMNLAPGEEVQTPCCVPANLSSISILYHDDDDRGGVVLKSYTDMVVVTCGCR